MTLGDLFEKVKDNSLRNHRLCATHYLSAPGSSWDAMLKITKIELKLILDSDMYIFF